MNFDSGQKAMEMRKHREIYIFPASTLKTREPFTKLVDSIAVSVFVVNLVEFDKH